MSARQTGFAMLSEGSVQEGMDLAGGGPPPAFRRTANPYLPNNHYNRVAQRV